MLTKEQAQSIADKINGCTVIEDEVYSRLRITTRVTAGVMETPGGIRVELHGDMRGNDEATQMLTGNPILRRMFDKAKLEFRAGYDTGNSTLICSVCVQYHHPSGGSNGLELLRFAVDLESMEVWRNP